MSASGSSRRRGGVPREVHDSSRSTRAAGGGWVVFALALWLLSFAAPAGRADVLAPVDAPPPAPREFRAAWIASVANIDWPSRPGLSVGELRAEMKTLLDTAVAVGLNAVILQVRPAADAFYHSPFEPWSEYLTGQQGKAPGWFYDPLNDWVAEAHGRGLELHAWINPYRARHPSAKGPLAPEHLANQRPDVVRTYGDFLWMDPAEPAAQRRTLDVAADLVARYDIDGLHIDDYFYPYPIDAPAGSRVAGKVDFPDDAAWQRYRKSGGSLSRADWRRSNVDKLVRDLYATVRSVKPWVRFGISPFGIGRPDLRPPGVEGFSQYDQLYADVELWLEQGWMDYCAPQLYWPSDRKAQPFGVLLDYWISRNPKGRHMWPGLFTSSVAETPKGWAAEEIVRQVAQTRERPAATGHIHFSMIALQQDRRGVAGRLRTETYAQPALAPATPWLSTQVPEAPQILGRNLVGPAAERSLLLAPGLGGEVARYAVWRREAGQWTFAVQPAKNRVVSLAPQGAFGRVEAVVVSAVDRLGNESPRVTVVLP
jgi:uncharacterized lipoprotein YddW (UPF0748 family)